MLREVEINPSHFSDGTPGAQRDAKACAKPRNQAEAEPGFGIQWMDLVRRCFPAAQGPHPASTHAAPRPCLTLSRYRSRISRPQLEQMFLPADGTEEAAEGGEQTDGVLGVQGEARPSSLSRAPARASASD